MKIELRHKVFEVTDGRYNDTWKYINSGKWEPETFSILDNFIGNHDVVLDLGAWIGAVSLYAALLSQEVYAIEPDPVAFAELEKNVRQNPALPAKIKCCNLAISNENAKFTLYAREKYGVSSSSLLPRIRDAKSDVLVEGMTLKAFIERENIKKIDFIKMDIEGGEFELLPSLAGELKKMNLPTLYISFHYHYLVEHQYYLKVHCRLISKVMMKLEKWSGVELFRKITTMKVLKALHSLKDYQYVYDESGHELNHTMIHKNPSIIIKHNLVFTTKRWNQ
jgi:FkbM family methyltransferase